MEMILLVTPEMMPIPNGIVCRFLSNSYKIVDKENNRKVIGKECFLIGDEKIFIKWLKDFKDLYIAIDRGKWQHYAVK